MPNMMLLTGLLVVALSGCVQTQKASEEQANKELNDTVSPLSKKCEDAKHQLDKTVKEGQLSDLKELKRNIELYCIWRRD